MRKTMLRSLSLVLTVGICTSLFTVKAYAADDNKRTVGRDYYISSIR
ncbi:MAG: hypothetical protein E7G24_06450 [Clostridium celatum]|nr:hypothetical protein [Clostridium celatum]